MTDTGAFPEEPEDDWPPICICRAQTTGIYVRIGEDCGVEAAFSSTEDLIRFLCATFALPAPWPEERAHGSVDPAPVTSSVIQLPAFMSKMLKRA